MNCGIFVTHIWLKDMGIVIENGLCNKLKIVTIDEVQDKK